MDLLDKLRIAFRLKRRVVEPKVYMVVLRSADGLESLHAVTDYSLESAFSVARKQAKEENMAHTDPSPKMWSILTMDSLLQSVTAMDVQGEAVPEGKNALMRDILASKDPAMLESHREELTSPEYEYLKEALAAKP